MTEFSMDKIYKLANTKIAKNVLLALKHIKTQSLEDVHFFLKNIFFSKHGIEYIHLNQSVIVSNNHMWEQAIVLNNNVFIKSHSSNYTLYTFTKTKSNLNDIIDALVDAINLAISNHITNRNHN